MIDEHHEAQKKEKQAVAERIGRDLKLAAGLRRNAAADPVRAGERDALRQWQADRLARTYPNLLADSRYGPAAAFFLSDLYGPKDFSARDSEIERILPMLVKALPLSGLSTLSLAIVAVEPSARCRVASSPTAVEKRAESTCDRDCQAISATDRIRDAAMPPTT